MPGKRRGSPLLLSPSDFQLVQQWREAGIPKEAILRGIDRYFGRSRRAKRVVSIAYCEDDVRAIWQAYRDGATGEEALEGASAPFDKEHFFHRLREEFTAAIDRVTAEGVPWLTELLAEVRERAEDLSQLSMSEEEIERTLRALDQDIMERLMEREGAEALSMLQLEARKELEPYRAKMEEAIFEELITRKIKRVLRDRYQLPHLSLIAL